MLYCSALKCVHNNRQSCQLPGVTIAYQKNEVVCKNYKEIPNYIPYNHSFNLPFEDSEFANEFSFKNDVRCSQSSCIYNVHYACKAKILKIKGENSNALCKTYYEI